MVAVTDAASDAATAIESAGSSLPLGGICLPSSSPATSRYRGLFSLSPGKITAPESPPSIASR